MIERSSAPSIPSKLEKWLEKGKKGKEVMLYTHDDLDGIFSAVEMKNYLIKHGFKIHGYGIQNYQEGWSGTILDPNYINIVVDFAEDVDGIDVYIDHHGVFEEGDWRGNTSIKTPTDSAYEGICYQLGIPVDEITLAAIDMVDSAKYDEYGVNTIDIIKFNEPDWFEGVLRRDNLTALQKKLTFVAAFNQLLKRSDYNTFIEVIHNLKNVSIYAIYDLFKKLYPKNNPITPDMAGFYSQSGYQLNDISEGELLNTFDKPHGWMKRKRYGRFEDQPVIGYKSFIKDADFRINTMINKTRNGKREYIRSGSHFISKFFNGEKMEIKGYQIIGNLIYVHGGTWANALRIRAIYEEDLLKGKIPEVNYKIEGEMLNGLRKLNGQTVYVHGEITGYLRDKINIKTFMDKNGEKIGMKGLIVVQGKDIYFKSKQPVLWLMLQYGNTLQVASWKNVNKYVRGYLPKLKDGTVVDNLGEYTIKLLNNMRKVLGYTDKKGKAGGHIGIGNISNIVGYCRSEKYPSLNGLKFIDIFKNKMISDLSGGVDWKINLNWGTDNTKSPPKKFNERVVLVDDCRTINERGEIIDAKGSSPLDPFSVYCDEKIKAKEEYIKPLIPLTTDLLTV